FQHTPAITPAPAAWEQTVARLMHAALYAMLIALPLLAWFGINSFGGTVKAWGMALPALTGVDKALGRTLIDTHKLIANIGHALAALKHHYISRDDTLRRMLPSRA